MNKTDIANEIIRDIRALGVMPSVTEWVECNGSERKVLTLKALDTLLDVDNLSLLDRAAAAYNRIGEITEDGQKKAELEQMPLYQEIDMFMIIYQGLGGVLTADDEILNILTDKQLPTWDIMLDAVRDTINAMPYRHLAYRMAYHLAVCEAASYDWNPVLNDYLAEELGSIHSLYKRKKAATPIDDIYTLLDEVANHVEIADRLGMDNNELAMYDALCTFYNPNFNARKVDMAKELSEWFFNHCEGYEYKQDFAHAVIEQIYQLASAHRVDADAIDDLAYEYIFNHLMLGMFDDDVYLDCNGDPEDEDENEDENDNEDGDDE